MEQAWQVLELQSHGEPLLIRKLDKALDYQQGRDHIFYLTFGTSAPVNGEEFYSKQDSSTIYDAVEPAVLELETATDSLLVAVITAPRLRDYLFYSANTELFLEQAALFRDRFPQFKIGCEGGLDPTWKHYSDLP